MKKQISLTPILAAALLIVLVVGYLLVIKPQRDSAGKLDEEIAALETTLTAARAADDDDEEPGLQIDYADLFRLAKAMPDEEDMPGIVLELDAIASSSGVKFIAIQPQTVVSKGFYRALPITLTFDGNYYDLTDFLYRIRNLVTVRNGALDATGRLYTLDSIDMHESQAGFPKVEAALTVSAYVFGSGPGAAAALPGQAPAQPAPATTSPASTTPASTTTTPASTEPAPAPAQPRTEALEVTP